MLIRISEELVRSLSEAREELDALNVFPVPDGDTGTNLFLTFETAHGELRALAKEQPDLPMPEFTAAYARFLLFAARGNSGVIMSQLVGAMVRRMVEPQAGETGPMLLAASMTAE